MELSKKELEIILSWYKLVENLDYVLDLDQEIVQKLKKELFFKN